MEQADNSVNRRRARGGVQVGARACTVQPGIRSSQRVATAPRPVRNFYFVGGGVSVARTEGGLSLDLLVLSCLMLL